MKKPLFLVALLFAVLFNCQKDEVFNDVELIVFEDANIKWGDSLNKLMARRPNQNIRVVNDLRINETIFVPSNTYLNFENTRIIPQPGFIGESVIQNANKSNVNIVITGGLIDGSEIPNTPIVGLLFNNVTRGIVIRTKTINLHTTESADTGNFKLVNCDGNVLKLVEARGTWKAGIWIQGGTGNRIHGGYIEGTHDSGLIGDTDNLVVDGLWVKNCGTSNGSNISGKFTNSRFVYCISEGATGITNGNGINIGQGSTNTLVDYNLFYNNYAKGAFVQGDATNNILFKHNIFLRNGLQTNHLSSGGLAIYTQVNFVFSVSNDFVENRRGVEIRAGATNNTIMNNIFLDNLIEDITDGGTNTTITGVWTQPNNSFLFHRNWLSDNQRQRLTEILTP